MYICNTTGKYFIEALKINLGWSWEVFTFVFKMLLGIEQIITTLTMDLVVMKQNIIYKYCIHVHYNYWCLFHLV